MLPITSAYRQKIENNIKKNIDVLFGVKNHLRDACEYALLNGGKRFRPVIVHLIADSLNPENEVDVSFAALSIECFHGASLVADDLPCMDDDDFRRSMPSLHKVYGDGLALLASYGLIAAGYECIAKNTESLHSSISARVGVHALNIVSKNMGLLGATGGQFLDLIQTTPSEELLKEIIFKKTVTLFEVSFVLGWLFGGGSELKLEDVKKAAYHFGMAFQLADDLGDLEQDRLRDCKSNLALVCGVEKAILLFREELQAFQKKIEYLNINSNGMQELLHVLRKQVEKVDLTR